MNQEKEIGNRIVLNKRNLRPKKDKNYAEIIAFGDTHYGHPCSDIEKAEAYLRYCLRNEIYVIGMGDYIECGTRFSIGESVYIQKKSPHEQMDFAIEKFEPLAKAGLIVGLYDGNHEWRIMKDSGINIVKIICERLKVPYLGLACWNLFYVGKQKYFIYGLHGASGAKFIYTKMKALVDISHNFDADVMLMAHCHDLAEAVIINQGVMNGEIVETKKYLVLTGGFLRYDQSYAQAKGMSIGKSGCPKIKLFSDKKDIHISS